MSTRIGLLGGSGAVGALLAQRLRNRGLGELVLAGRNAAQAQQVIDEKLGGAAEFETVELWDAHSLARFVGSCTMIVNCAGPTRRILDRVARAAVDAGVDYVDAGGDHPVYERLTQAAVRNEPRIVLSAGMIPGLTGLAPRYLAAGFDTVDTLTVYHGIRDTFGYSSAYDYVVGIRDADDEPLAAWRGGPRSNAARRVDIALPHFPDTVTAQPYLSPEARRVAAALGLTSGTWFSVLDGERVPVLLQQVPGIGAEQIGDMAEKVRRAAELDVVGRARHATLLFEMRGTVAGAAHTRSLVVRAGGAAALVAAVAASAVGVLAAGRIEPGVHYAAEVLPPAEVIADLGADPAVVHLGAADVTLDELVEPEEGAL